MLGPSYHPKGVKIGFWSVTKVKIHMRHCSSGDVATSPLEQNRLRFVSFRFFAFISKMVNNQCCNPYISGKILKDLSGNVWVVALIVNRFRNNRQKHQHRRLNSYRGDLYLQYDVLNSES